MSRVFLRGGFDRVGFRHLGIGIVTTLLLTSPLLAQTGSAKLPDWGQSGQPAQSPSTQPAENQAKPIVAKAEIPWKKKSDKPFSEKPFVMSMAQDKAGAIWFGTEGEGVWRFDSSLPGGEKWHKYTTSDGLGDDNAYALACDRLGRVWVGHLNHGVSVFNGQMWQNYEVVGGLSNSKTLSGPLGERIFAIAVCPADGDVWMASNAGLARYSEKKDVWSYYTRMEGLSSDQANAMAFDKEGNIYVGTPCDGIAMADAKDDYKSWRAVKGPESLPLDPIGNGLPSSLINDLLVSRDGTVFAATTLGLAWSSDQGKTWNYARGKDWADKVKGLVKGPPQGWTETGGSAKAQVPWTTAQPAASNPPLAQLPWSDPKSPAKIEPSGAWLAEDYITCLAEGEEGLWVGYRQKGCELADPRTGKTLLKGMGGGYVKALLARGNGFLAGTYGTDPLNTSSLPHQQNPAKASAESPKFPAPAAAMGLEELKKYAAGLQNDKQEVRPVYYVGSDWITQGDWVGRYGRKSGVLCAAGSPDDHVVSYGLAEYEVSSNILNPLASTAGIRNWCWNVISEERRVLWDPTIGIRRPAGWDDHGEAYAMSKQGPNVQVRVTVPEGVHQVALYFVNYDGHAGNNLYRDYRLRVRFKGNQVESEAARVADFYNGVYQNYILTQSGDYDFIVDRNYSFNTMISGVFVSKISGKADPTDNMPLPWLGSLKYGPSKVLWKNIKLPYVTDLLEAKNKLGLPGRQRALIETLRHAVQNKVEDSALGNLRWNAHLWSAKDRQTHDQTMKTAWETMQKMNPALKIKNVRPNSPNKTTETEK